MKTIFKRTQLIFDKEKNLERETLSKSLVRNMKKMRIIFD